MNYLNTEMPLKIFQNMADSPVYVDKSMLIHMLFRRIDTADRYICVTRPRRFGKTVNACMLGAYFSKGFDSSRLFDRHKIAAIPEYTRHRNQYNVIYMDFSILPDFCENYKDYYTNIIESIKEDLCAAYPATRQKKYRNISQMLRDTGDTFIFILDEWDFVFHQKFMTRDSQSAFLGFLRGLLKDQPYVSLAYMTGILPVAKYSSGSELNMFQEYNFMNDSVYERYFGLTEDEVKDLCAAHRSVGYEELKRWYDGYYLSDGGSLFNPRSVSSALIDGVCRNYWTETGPMNEIADCIEHNTDAVREDIVKMVAGIPVPVKLDGYSAAEGQLNTRNEILSAMVVYGFLSYYEGNLRIPNHELMEKFESVLVRESMGEVKKVVESSREILRATLMEEEETVARILEEVHDREIPFLQYNDENALSCVITLCYLSARDDYTVEREAKSGKGYCDYLFLPRRPGKPALILELKTDGSCEEALTQIRKRNYLEKAADFEEVLLVGICYDRKEKKHHCKIEKIEKTGLCV